MAGEKTSGAPTRNRVLNILRRVRPEKVLSGRRKATSQLRTTGLLFRRFAGRGLQLAAGLEAPGAVPHSPVRRRALLVAVRLVEVVLPVPPEENLRGADPSADTLVGRVERVPSRSA